MGKRTLIRVHVFKHVLKRAVNSSGFLHGMQAVGSQSHITLIDGRAPSNQHTCIEAVDITWGECSFVCLPPCVEDVPNERATCRRLVVYCTDCGARAVVSLVWQNGLLRARRTVFIFGSFQAGVRPPSGVRSLSLLEHLLTSGSGQGRISFLDLRTMAYLPVRGANPSTSPSIVG
eukprot:9393347-Pyramimonas_sp.AAC.1